MWYGWGCVLMASYLVVNMVVNNEAFTFIVVILLSAADFWTVKNVTGRLLVGLKWTNEQLEDGTEKWTFESYDEQFVANSTDSAFFWTSQLVGLFVWGLFLFVNVISLSIYWVHQSADYPLGVARRHRPGPDRHQLLRVLQVPRR